MEDKIKQLRLDLAKAIESTEKIRVKLDDDPDFRTEKNAASFDEGVTEVKSLRKQLEDLEALDSADKFMNNPKNQAKADEVMTEVANAPLAPGDALVKSEDFQRIFNMSKSERGQFSMVAASDYNPARAEKATFTQATATLTGYERPPGIFELGQQMPLIAQLFAQGETNQPTIRYQKEDTYTNAADSVTEGNAIAEATFDTSEVDSAVRKMGVRSRQSNELFDDFPAVRDYVNARLVFMARQTIDTQLYTGSGTPPDIDGILNVSGIQTQAKGVDTEVDAIHKAITLVRSTGFFEPDYILLHPNDWETIRLSKDDSNQYYGGGPFGTLEGDRLWGVRVVVSALATENTGLVGAFRLGAQVFYNGGMMVEVANQNQDDFEKDLISIRVTQRLALACYRPLAFCTVTGI